MIWQVPLCRPTFDNDQLEQLVEAYRSGWLTVGPRTALAEEAFCEYTGASHAVAVSSCSAALHLACVALDFKGGDEVIAPSLTFASTVSGVTHVGARPRFVDIAGPTEPWPSAELVEAAIGERTAGIVTMGYGGHPGDVDAIAELARSRGLKLIEDVAHGAGTRSQGKHLGTFGDAGAFSFSSSKNLGIGEGGMLITDDPELAGRVARLSWHGVGSQAWLRHHERAPEYELGTLGFNYRFDDPRAALLQSCLVRLDAQNERRGQIDRTYREAFADEPLFEATVAPPEVESASYCLFTGVLDPSVDREAFRKDLADRGVQTTVHYPLLHTHGALEQTDLRLPVSEDFAARCVTLPLYPQMEEWQSELVVEATRESLTKSTRPAAAA
jgi:dTDP-4-amino-4,6-dideoxygalactose transaminase